MTTQLQRVLVLLAAALAIAWLAVSYGNAHAIRHAQVVSADPHSTPAEIDAAIRDARSAHTLDPGRTESLSYVAALEIRAGRLDEARRAYEEIVRLEPDTAEAWVVLSELTQRSDPARSAQALAQAKRLDPLGTGAPPQR
jgi:cytochrome c-type biogenesis protein CcmH/NrfG